MPNDVSNKMYFLKYLQNISQDYSEHDPMDQLRAITKSEDRPFDFNTLIPYPEKFAKLDKAHKEAIDQGIGYFAAPRDGYNQGGYEWCVENWGTKWNSYSVAFDYSVLFFETAWSTPVKIFKEISKRFPEYYLVIEYADEDTGHNCGVIILQDGFSIQTINENDMPNSILFARAIQAECRAADSWRQVQELQQKVKELSSKPPTE